jgi:hypothetical protein
MSARTLFRAAALAVAAVAVRVDEESLESTAPHPHAARAAHSAVLAEQQHPHQLSPHTVARKKHHKERAKEMAAQSEQVAAAYGAAQKISSAKAMKSVQADEEATLLVAKAEKEAARTDHLMKEAHAEAIAKAKIAKDTTAKFAKAEEDYARAWGHADERELEHAHAVEAATAAAAVAKDAHEVMSTAQAASQKAAEQKEEAMLVATDHTSKYHAIKMQSKAVAKKAIQLAKHKVTTESIALKAELDKQSAEKVKETTHKEAVEAAKEKEASAKAAAESLEANIEARDESNMKTGVAFRALQDKVGADIRAEKRTGEADTLKKHHEAIDKTIEEPVEEAAEEEPVDEAAVTDEAASPEEEAAVE